VEEEEIAPSPQEKEKDESSFQYVTILSNPTIHSVSDKCCFLQNKRLLMGDAICDE